MAYEILANSRTPALYIYVLDISASMTTNLGGRRRIDVVMDAMQATLQQMVFRCTKGGKIAPRYRVAMFAYSDKVYDIMGGGQDNSPGSQFWHSRNFPLAQYGYRPGLFVGGKTA